MVSVAYTRVDRGQERKFQVRVETKVKEKQLDLGSDRKVSNPIIRTRIDRIRERTERIDGKSNSKVKP